MDFNEIETLIKERGNPTLFISASCNEKWPEVIKQMIPLTESREAINRPDILMTALRERLKELISKLRRGIYFGENSRVEYLFYSIVFQMPQLPILHMGVKLINVNLSTVHDSIEFIDSYIRAEYPTSADYPLISRHKLYSYQALVFNYMIHKCKTGTINQCKIKNDDHCILGYGNNTVAATTIGAKFQHRILAPIQHRKRYVRGGVSILSDTPNIIYISFHCFCNYDATDEINT
jgi:hypothetical protein